MRLDDYRTSDNVEDQRGMNFGGGGSGGLGLIGMLLGGGKIGVAIAILLILGTIFFGGDIFGGGGQRAVPQAGQSAGRDAAAACAVDQASTFSCRVLASTEDTWARIFQEEGGRYTPAKLAFYGGTGQSGCGAAQAAMGPFYCPSDNGIYLDTSFFRELEQRFGAAGDFAQAYVIAHEVGHHVQALTGVADQVRRAQARSNEATGNALQVKMELQADCYAGVWAARNRDRIEPGDVEEGLRAAQAIGDDTLQKAAGQRPVPESFTHGTSAERMQWLKRGLDSGDPAQCDTFAG
ncbi:zinc metalloprotease [Sphingomonas oleivorans]|uniref:Zinc metalloprotease n=1 Tax=Sphingomonas oleivorans TaxID=1735121 RepID=A0A2T5G0H1_9SPHN|nr:neutral zinc metallopeptidase [Sphingomonas oleivorans]PTQ12647.1 zinc metalloprotease [Sphingomonas oleivorans]